MFTFKVHGKPAVQVQSVEDAAAKWSQYRDRTEAGCSEIGNGGIVREDGKIVARVSYNGRIWNAKGDAPYVRPQIAVAA